jgi:hypothetical protein
MTNSSFAYACGTMRMHRVRARAAHAIAQRRVREHTTRIWAFTHNYVNGFSKNRLEFETNFVKI